MISYKIIRIKRKYIAEITKLRFIAKANSYPHFLENTTSLDFELSDEDLNKKVNKMRIKMMSPNFKVYIAVSSKKVLGYISFKMKDQSTWIIESLYIDPQYQSQGIGAKLLRKAFSQMRDAEIIQLFVLKKNSKAISFYKGFGFQASGKSKLVNVGKGIIEPAIQLALNL